MCFWGRERNDIPTSASKCVALHWSSSVLITKANQIMKTVHLARREEGDKSSDRRASGVRKRDSSWISEFFSVCHFCPPPPQTPSHPLLLAFSRNEIFMEALDFISCLSSCQPPALLLLLRSLLQQQRGHLCSLQQPRQLHTVYSRSSCIYARAIFISSSSYSSHPPFFFPPTQKDMKNSKMVKWKMRESVRAADVTRMGRRTGGDKGEISEEEGVEWRCSMGGAPSHTCYISSWNYSGSWFFFPHRRANMEKYSKSMERKKQSTDSIFRAWKINSEVLPSFTLVMLKLQPVSPSSSGSSKKEQWRPLEDSLNCDFSFLFSHSNCELHLCPNLQ